MPIRERLASMIEDLASVVDPPRAKDVASEAGWPLFPPIPDDCSHDEFVDYLDRCEVAEVVVNATSHVSVVLLDAGRQRWVFRFGRAGLELERYTDEHGTEGPGPGIEELSMYTVKAKPGEACQDDVTFYLLGGAVGLVIEGRTVEVTAPGKEPRIESGPVRAVDG